MQKRRVAAAALQRNQHVERTASFGATQTLDQGRYRWGFEQTAHCEVGALSSLRIRLTS